MIKFINQNKILSLDQFGFRKGFSTESAILYTKLEHYGFRGKILELLMSFISNRKYFVSVNGSTSETKTVNIGVPGGSTLGPLLFLLYVNDMSNSSSRLNFTQFTDDTTIIHSGPNIVLLTKEIEQ